MHIPRNRSHRNRSTCMDGFKHGTNILCSFLSRRKKLSMTKVPIGKEWLNESWNMYTLKYYATIKKTNLEG